jgi:acetyl esterase
MTTRHLVDPELLPFVDAAPCDPITSENLAVTRAAMAERFATLPRHDVQPTRHLVPGREGAPDVRVFVYDPPGTTGLRPAILHLHGGGMIAGRAELTIFGTAPIALAQGVVIVSVDYRLAPETAFPGPHEDCYAAFEWMFENAERLRVDPARIAVSGDSAGGGLAAAVTLMARDRGSYGIAAQFLTYPMLDCRTGGPDDPYRNSVTGALVWTSDRNRFCWDALRGTNPIDAARMTWFSPSLAADLRDLPPAWIGTGTLDLFFDENIEYARRLCAAGVSVDFHSYAGAVHGFNTQASTNIAKRFASAFEQAIQRHLFPDSE